MARFASVGSGRGYTLVEMAITLVVIGLLMGAILMPLGSRLRTEQYEQARTDLVAIKEAIVAYTATSSAPGFHWVHWNGTRTVYSEGRLPAGRRFLPCPDLDGDGIEDRIGQIDSGDDLSTSSLARTEAFFSHLGDFDIGSDTILETEGATVPVTMAVSGMQVTVNILVRNPVSTVVIGSTNPVRAGGGVASSRREVLAFEQDDPPAQLSLGGTGSYGHCASDTGAVPWATLGTPSSDPWGNRYVYRVDPYFSHSLLGFGPESRVDIFDPTRALMLSGEPAQFNLYAHESSADLDQDSIISFYEYQRKYDESDPTTFTYEVDHGSGDIVSSKLPGLVCLDGIDADDCKWSQLARITIALTPVPYLGEVSHDDRDMVIWDTFDGRQVQREYNQGEPIDGMAFVVISTGNNRHGGIPSTNQRSSRSGDGYINCLSPLVDNGTELLNMPRHACNRPAPPSNSGRESYRFFQLPVVRGGFDDELAYMSGRELVGRLAADGVDLGPIWMPPGERN